METFPIQFVAPPDLLLQPLNALSDPKVAHVGAHGYSGLASAEAVCLTCFVEEVYDWEALRQIAIRFGARRWPHEPA